MRLSTRIEHDLEQVVGSLGIFVGRGAFTLDLNRAAISVRPLLLEKPHLLVASFLRVLHGLQPSELHVVRCGPSLSLEAHGVFNASLTPPEPDGVKADASADAMNLLTLLVASAPYQECGIAFEDNDIAWRFSSKEGAQKGTGTGSSRIRLWLSQPGEKWRDQHHYLRAISGYCPFPVIINDRPLSGLVPLEAQSDLYLKVSPGYSLDFAFAAAAPAMLETGRGAFREVGDNEPLAAIRETAHDSSLPTLVRLSSEIGKVGLRFLRQGVLTDPIPLPTRCPAKGEVIVKDDRVQTDFTGLCVLPDEIPQSLISEAARRADYAWATVGMAYHEGKERFSTAGGGFLRSDAGRVMASFIALAIWIGLCIPMLIQPFNTMEADSTRLLLAPPLLTALFGPPLALLMRTLRNLKKYRAGDDPFIWVYHRWDELSR